MKDYDRLQKELHELQAQTKALQAEGDCLQNCWLEATKAGGTARGQAAESPRYRTLRSRQPMFGGKKSKYVPLNQVAAVEGAIARGKELSRLQRRIAQVEGELGAIEQTAARLGLQLPRKLVMHSSETSEWYTLPEWIEKARRVMGGIDLDPASNPEAQTWIKAGHYYTQADDGMEQPWFGAVWLNPPYGQQNKAQKVYGASAWIKRAIAEYEAGNIDQAILWLRASGNSGIKALEAGGYPRVVLGRIHHAPAGANGIAQKGAGHDTVVYYLGCHEDAFYSEFGSVAPTKPKSRRKPSKRLERFQRRKEKKDIQLIPDGTLVRVPAGWEAVITGYAGDDRYHLRFNTGLKGVEDTYPSSILKIV